MGPGLRDASALLRWARYCVTSGPCSGRSGTAWRLGLALGWFVAGSVFYGFCSLWGRVAVALGGGGRVLGGGVTVGGWGARSQSNHDFLDSVSKSLDVCISFRLPQRPYHMRQKAGRPGRVVLHFRSPRERPKDGREALDRGEAS